MIVKFGDRIYGKDGNKLLVWDAGWDTFRPVDKLVWNPVRRDIQILYGQLCSELFDIHYGFGDTHPQCVEFTDKFIADIETAPHIETIDEFWTWTGQPTEWFYDRQIVLHPCSRKPSRAEYLTIMKLRAKTAKRIPRQIRGTLKRRKH
jgi:preprotein translocase subunit Sss1